MDKAKKSKSKGFSLLAIILALTFFSILGYVALSMLSTTGQKASDYLDSEKAFHIAEGALQIAMRTMKANWENWKNAANFPGGSLGGGTFALSVYDDDDGDNNPNVDSNRLVIVSSTGYYNQARRKIITSVKKSPGPLDVVLYTSSPAEFGGNAHVWGDIFETDPNLSITFDKPENHEVGEVIYGKGGTIPSINTAGYIALAKANKLNGFSGTEGNYFRGDFSSKPDSLNGVIYIDTYTNGSPADVKINSNVDTESGTGSPAVIIVMGDLKINGTINFKGLIYVAGQVQYSPEIELLGNATIEGGIISSNTTNAGTGNLKLIYNASYIQTTTNLTNIYNVNSSDVYTSQTKELYN
jgi:type II secretory pathway pseudopilin PulG